MKPAYLQRLVPWSMTVRDGDTLVHLDFDPDQPPVLIRPDWSTEVRWGEPIYTREKRP